ncbi:hypothetical protein [Macrococcoides goetzii]|nr:hypothetical protein [Macrococcus goetzii]
MNKLVRLIIKLSPILIPIVKAQLEKRAQQQSNTQSQHVNNK